MVTGTESYTREVSSRLPGAAPDLRWRFFAARAKADLGIDVMVLPFPRLWSQVRLPLHLASEHPQLLFVPGHVIPFAWPGRVLTVVHDLAFERYPEAYGVAERSYLQLTTRWAVTRCPLLIAVSESTRDDLVDIYGVRPERVRVVHLGINPPEVAPAPASRLDELGLDGSFVLQVGRIEKRKNQSAALAAVEKLEGVTLVVAGSDRDPVLAQQLHRSTRCRVLGRVDQPTLELLYERAEAVIAPSLYEGFGLPVLEAMARGKVVVAAMNSSLPEVGGEAVLYFHPSATPDQLAGILEVALRDDSLRTELARLAQARAAIFTWDKTAAGVAGVIKELVSS
ncbi:MAG TPA: glycosyltransferase family 1 protein [Candidatus Dormibacteraeota bacterium]|nr:glycosyltransferase family 1 protein [Candidatus Dormibacteraeota bacterium]